MVAPAASTKELTGSVTVQGVTYQRVDLATLRTTPRRELLVVEVPATTRSIVVRASCRLAVLHNDHGKSAFELEMR